MAYIMTGQLSELERLQLQSRVWEPAGERLLATLGPGVGLRALDMGCGAMGWLRALSRWVGESGEVVGVDIDASLLETAGRFRAEEGLTNTQLVQGDYFATQLPEASFDLVHLRFQIAPLGRAKEQMALALRLLKPGGWIALEDPETGSWRENPLSSAADRLRELILQAFEQGGGDFNSGRRLPEYLRAAGIAPAIRAECFALEPGHPYLRLPIQFATSLRPRLTTLVSEAELDALIEAANSDLADPACWGTTFTLIQAWGRKPA
jgi:SAM-dependent methyltransferase